MYYYYRLYNRFTDNIYFRSNVNLGLIDPENQEAIDKAFVIMIDTEGLSIKHLTDVKEYLKFTLETTDAETFDYFLTAIKLKLNIHEKTY